MTTRDFNLESVKDIEGIEFITDQQAQSVSAGAFRYGTSPNDGNLHFSSDSSAVLRSTALGNGAPLRLQDRSSGLTNGTFNIEYFANDGRLLGTDRIGAVSSLFPTKLDAAPSGSTQARITRR